MKIIQNISFCFSSARQIWPAVLSACLWGEDTELQEHLRCWSHPIRWKLQDAGTQQRVWDQKSITSVVRWRSHFHSEPGKIKQITACINCVTFIEDESPVSWLKRQYICSFATLVIKWACYFSTVITLMSLKNHGVNFFPSFNLLYFREKVSSGSAELCGLQGCTGD